MFYLCFWPITVHGLSLLFPFSPPILIKALFFILFSYSSLVNQSWAYTHSLYFVCLGFKAPSCKANIRYSRVCPSLRLFSCFSPLFPRLCISTLLSFLTFGPVAKCWAVHTRMNGPDVTRALSDHGAGFIFGVSASKVTQSSANSRGVKGTERALRVRLGILSRRRRM